MVLIWHYVDCQDAARIAPAFADFRQATGLFWSGVDLFFVLSGFLIGGILLDDSAHAGFYRAFYVRRAARILPAYAFLLAGYFGCRALLDPQRYAWLFSAAIPDGAYLTFTQNIFMGFMGLQNKYPGNFLDATWSLAVEEQFYLVIPLLLLLAGIPRFKRVSLLLILVAPCLRLAFPGFPSVVNMPFRMDSLLIGVLLAALFRSEQAVGVLQRYRAALWGVFGALFLAMGVLTFKQAGRAFLEPTVIALFYAVLLALALLHRGGRVTAVLRSATLVRLGFYSYGIYLYHQAVAGLIHGYFRGEAPSIASPFGAWLTLLSLGCTLLLAAASRHSLEALFLNRAKGSA